MQKHFENRNEFETGNNMPKVEWGEWLLNGIFVTAGSAILAYIFLLLMQVYVQWHFVNF